MSEVITIAIPYEVYEELKNEGFTDEDIHKLAQEMLNRALTDLLGYLERKEADG